MTEQRSEFTDLLSDWKLALEQERFVEAGDVASKVMDLAVQIACEEGPTPENLLWVEAEQCENAADWRGAEAAYRKLLDIAIKSDSASAPCKTYRAFSDLSSSHALLDRDDTAYEYAKAATEAARRTNVSIIVSMALREEASCGLWIGRNSDSEAAANEAVHVLDGETLTDIPLGQALVVRADCKFHLGMHDSAKRDLNATWKCLAPLSVIEDACGVHWSLAGYWSTTAKLRSAEGDLRFAASAWASAIDIRRKIAGRLGVYTQNALAVTLWQYGQFMLRAGETLKAQVAIAEAQDIRERIGLPRHFRTKFNLR